jgi:hypothetical protein
MNIMLLLGSITMSKIGWHYKIIFSKLRGKKNIIFKQKFKHTFHIITVKRLKKEVLRPKWLILAHVDPVYNLCT